jgi:hypothetical protein
MQPGGRRTVHSHQDAKRAGLVVPRDIHVPSREVELEYLLRNRRC